MTPFPPERQRTSGLKPDGRVRTPETGSQTLRDEMAAFAHEATRIEISRLATIRELPSPYQAVEQAVDALFAAGFRRLFEDDDTINRLADALHTEECGCGDFDEHLTEVKTQFDEDDDDTYHRMARVVVRALREDTT